MILPILSWWLASTLVGAAAFPLAFRWLDRLPDRGFGIARTLGILACGYLLWLGASLGWIRNSPGGAVLVVILLGWVSLAVARKDLGQIRGWLRTHWRTVLVMEIAFLLAFVAWAVVRAFNPEIVATEKPMELAFLNAILRSPSFPPQDPWLSGYGISYYYLGYVLLAFMTWLTGTAPGVSFNLGNALWFALVVVGSYAVVYNLLTLNRGVPRRLAAFLGPLFVVITGNLGGVLEVLHARHAFWTRLADGTMVSRFWTWLNLEDLAAPPVGPSVFPPDRFWWWWQASRVVNDIDLAGRHVEVIDEFPFFSFLLADNHPHVLALPFAILAIVVAIQILANSPREAVHVPWIKLSNEAQRRILYAVAGLTAVVAVGSSVSVFGAQGWSGDVAGIVVRRLTLAAIGLAAFVGIGTLATGRVRLALTAQEWILVGWLVGVLAFLNTWDVLAYSALIIAAAAWGMRRIGFSRWVGPVVASGVGVLVVAGLSIAPWIPTFKSQAGGILPNLVFPTRLPQFLIMFLVLLVPVSIWLLLRAGKELGRPGTLRSVLMMVVGLPLLLLVGTGILAGVIAAVAPQAILEATQAVGASGTGELVVASLSRRLASPWVPLLLAFLLALVWFYLRREGREPIDRPGDIRVFVALMIGLGAILVLFPEFAYLRDLFGTRMNTVFKFYYAAWLLWGLAAAYGLTELWDLGRRRGLALGLTAALPLLLGLVYPVTALWEKTSHFSIPGGPTLDGTAHLTVDNPQDAVAIAWMRATLQPGTIAEAVGGSYTSFGRISAHTGFPTVLGWDFHEYQWRGSFAPQGTRKEDMERLYLTRDWDEARRILEQYGIDYVYVGPLERMTYPGLVTRKFDVFMDPLFAAGDVTIYGRRTEVGS